MECINCKKSRDQGLIHHFLFIPLPLLLSLYPKAWRDKAISASVQNACITAAAHIYASSYVLKHCSRSRLCLVLLTEDLVVQWACAWSGCAVWPIKLHLTRACSELIAKVVWSFDMLDFISVTGCLVAQTVLSFWKTECCGQLAPWWTRDSEKQPIRWANHANLTINPLIWKSPMYFKTIMALHVSVLNLQRSWRNAEQLSQRVTYSHTYTHIHTRLGVKYI